MPTSPESDGEIYLTPNTSVSADDEKNGADSGIDENHVKLRNVDPLARLANGSRMDKIHSMTGIGGLERAADDPSDSGTDEKVHGAVDEQAKNCKSGMYRNNSMGNLSQYEREFDSKPKSLLKLKEEFERRRIAMMEQSSPSRLSDDGQSERLYARPRNALQRTLKKRFGIGDTKYIGTDNDTPEQRQYHLTKIKSLSTIQDSESSDRIRLDPFLTPMIPRRHPASLHSFEEEHRNSDSSDEQDQQFDRHVAAGMDGNSFERGFRRSYNDKHDRFPESAIPLRQSDNGYFRVPKIPPVRQTNQQKNRTSSHSLPSDGKLEIARYGPTYTHTQITHSVNASTSNYLR